MSYDYDKLYGETPDALGPPTPEIVAFFAGLDDRTATVLDVGCGQGRDALFIARLGHPVVAVDLSPNGIRALSAAASAESLAIETQVADITGFVPPRPFDIILIDRTLHMLDRPSRLRVLDTLLSHVAENGRMIIADEPSNIADFIDTMTAHPKSWTILKRSKGLLFLHQT